MNNDIVTHAKAAPLSAGSACVSNAVQRTAGTEGWGIILSGFISW